MIPQNLIDHTKLNELSTYILNKIILRIKDQCYRICEIEYYIYCDEHKDAYTHQNNDQLEFGKFYFHKYKTGGYKSGTYKGMDITLGDKERNVYFGILIRSIYNLESKEFIEGPCRTVNKMLELFGKPDVKAFMVGKQQLSMDDPQNEVWLEEFNLPEEDVYQGPRIGLSDKYPEFRTILYRYATMIKSIKKERRLFIKIE